MDKQKHNFVVRNATVTDLDEVMEVEQSWPAEMRAPREKFASRLKVFPQGFYVVFCDGFLVGVTTSEVIHFSPNNPPRNWNAVTDNGWIVQTHNPQGNAIYAVSVGASLQNSGVGGELIAAQKRLVARLNLDYLILGARCPDYHAHQQMSIAQYIQAKRTDSQPLDKEIRFYTRNGLSVVAPMPEYMGKGCDPESADYGVIMTWKCPMRS